MPSPFPKLNLSHGQVLYALGQGAPLDSATIDRVRYLRRLGVPFRGSELGTGRGNRLRYSFEHLVELGVALFALRRGMPPRDVARYIIEGRTRLRAYYRKAYEDQPAAALDEPWVRSRGRIIPFPGNEIFLRMHDRYSQEPGKIELITQSEVKNLSDLFALVERYPGEESRTLLPLTRLVLELVVWAQEAPEISPGPSR